MRRFPKAITPNPKPGLPNNSTHSFDPSRRKAIGHLAILGSAHLLTPTGAWARSALPEPDSIPRPHLYWRPTPKGTLRTVSSVRESIQRPGIAQDIWNSIKAACHAEFSTTPLTCRSLIPGRLPVMAKQNNPDYTICHAAGQRILRHAIGLNMTGDKQYKAVALAQLEALFDPSIWPDWIDQAHLRFDLPADLRTGMLSQDCAIAFDWLYPFLDESEKAQIIEGIDRRGIQPFLESMRRDPWWSHDLNNWYSVIIGGLGLAGMALTGAHPQAAHLVEISVSAMRRYLSIYGSDGSFNESVAYSGSTRYPVAFFNALYYHQSGVENPLAQSPFPQTAMWTLHTALSGNRFAAFGDGPAILDDRLGFISAISAATRDPIIQDFAVRHLKTSTDPYTLLWYDPQVPRQSPAGHLSLGKVFPENSGLVFSRSSWDPDTAEMIVYGKSRQAQNHGHNDLGQLCIDTHGNPMIVDTGSPSSYPEDFFGPNRFRYYNASVKGHNVLMFGNREQRPLPRNNGPKGRINLDSVSGFYTKTFFNDTVGSYWQIDLTNAYKEATFVRRSVIHLLPGTVAVLDEAVLENKDQISLRWHTASPAPPDKQGNFLVTNKTSKLLCRTEPLIGNIQSLTLNTHVYRAPFDTDRTGQLLEQRHEPFVELIQKNRRCRILSLFSLINPSNKSQWQRKGNQWHIPNSPISVLCNENTLRIQDTASNKSLTLTL